METGPHSIWVSEQIQELGHEVIVANVRELRAISHSDRKSDKVDAEKIARYARLDPEILRPIPHRTVAKQETLTLICTRDVLVLLRTGAVNSVRGLAKPCGYRLPAAFTLAFAKRCLATLPPGLTQALGPLLHQIADMTVKIKQYDREIQKLTETTYPETQALIKVYGVGHLTALTFVLTLGNRKRFQRSRDVGCYLGLRPRRSQSGDSDPQLGITKAGNGTCDSCWSNAPTTSSGHTAKTQPCEDGVSAWGFAAEAMHEDEPWWPSPGSSPFCCIEYGLHMRSTCRSTK
jgi:transposase